VLERLHFCKSAACNSVESDESHVTDNIEPKPITEPWPN